MNTIFLIGSFNALFFALLLWQKKPKALHDKVLFLWLIMLAVYTGAYAITSEYLFIHKPLWSASLISLLMLHGPFLYLYLGSLATGKKHPDKNDLVHFIPFVCFNVYLTLSSFMPGWSKGISLGHVQNDGSPPLLFLLFLVLTALSGPVYFLLSVNLFRKLKVNIRNNFSFSEKIDPSWLRKLVIIFGIIWTALMAVAAIHHVFHLFSLDFCTNGLTLSLTIFIILIGYFGLRQKEIFISLPVVEASPIVSGQLKKYAGTGIKDEDAELLAVRLSAFMDESKPYLDPDLTLAGLSAMLNVPQHHLSRVINEHYGSNFFDFINRYRVEEVKLRIPDIAYSNLTLLGIAFESGFNSKSAFNRLFRKYTGVTPSEFKAGKALNV